MKLFFNVLLQNSAIVNLMHVVFCFEKYKNISDCQWNFDQGNSNNVLTLICGVIDNTTNILNSNYVDCSGNYKRYPNVEKIDFNNSQFRKFELNFFKAIDNFMKSTFRFWTWKRFKLKYFRNCHS